MTSAEAPAVSHVPAGNPARFVAWSLAERLLRSLITATVLAIVARHLQPQGFGLLNTAFALVAGIMPLAQFGLENVLVRDLVRRPAEAGALLGSAALLRLGIGCGCAVLIQLAVWIPGLASDRAVVAVASLLLLVQAGEVAELWFRRHVQARAIVLARTTAIFLGAAARLILVALDADVMAFALVQVVEGLLFLAGLLWAYSRADSRGPRWKWDGHVARQLWNEGRGFALAAVVGSVAARMDQFAVSSWLGPADAGRYFAALRLIEVPFFVATTAAVSLLPDLVAGGQQILIRNFTVASAFGWATALGATLTAPWLMRGVFGPDYTAAAPVLIVHAWACLPIFTGLIRAQYLAIHGASRTYLATALLTLAGQAGLNLAFVPRFGLVGAAGAFLLTQVASAWLFPLALPRLRPCLGPQVRGLLEAWRPGFWRELRQSLSHRPHSR